MNLRRLHRRLAVAMGMAGLVAFAVGAGFEPFSAVLAAVALVVAMVWQPDPEAARRMERVWLPLAVLLVVRALIHVFLIRDDVVIPVVDLLLLLMAAEALRSLDAPNDVRLYALSFALILAATAYRPGIVFLLAFVAYVGLATLALTVGHLRRQAERHGVATVPLGGGMVRTTVALSGVTLMVSAVVFVTFPRVSRGWAGRGETLATSIAGFSDQVSLGEHGGRIYANPQIVLRVEFPDGRPEDFLGLHWRGRSYDRFDGVRWTRSRALPPSSAPSAWYRDRWDGPILEQRIYGAPLDVRVLFAVHPAVDVEPENGIQPLFDNAGDYVYWGSGAPAYRAWSRTEGPDPGALRSADNGFAPSGRHFLQLPQDLDPRIRALADSLSAGLTNRYDIARAMLEHLRSFEYTLELPATAREATLAHFLFERRAGHCEYFSTAMAVLLRAAGVESRNVNGFLGGEWSQFGDYLAVTQNQAHSWVEVWFPGYGWVTMDPTPGGAGLGSVERAWFWPGRIWFDGLQHRWNKWVLDYSMDSQSGLFSSLSGMLGRERGPEASEPGGEPVATPWIGALALLLLGVGVFWARRGRTVLSPSARAYVRLREACERAGLPVAPGTTPRALVRTLRERRASAADPAERLVDLYLATRYGGRPATGGDLEEMDRALARVRATLRGPVPGGVPR